MTETLRTRAIRTALDATDSAAVVTAAAAVGLTAYRALASRKAETRITLALAAGALAAITADQTAYRALAPLRRRLGAEQHLAGAAGPVPSLEQLAVDAAADAAHRAAAGAARLDYGRGFLTRAENWTGCPDGTATCTVTLTAYVLAMPRPTDSDGYNSRSYLLLQNDQQPVPVHSLADLVALLDLPEAGISAEEDGDPWAAIGQDAAILELHPSADEDTADDGQGDEEEDVDREAEAWANGTL